MALSGIGAASSLTALLDRTIHALARMDAVSLTQVLADCSHAELPGTEEEFSRALTQQAALEKTLEQTRRNLRMLREEEPRYGRRRPGA